jgi:tetratricopeptide (TPR) repeat protein
MLTHRSIVSGLILAIVLTSCTAKHPPEVAETWDTDRQTESETQAEGPIIEAISLFGAGLIRPDFDEVSIRLLQTDLKNAVSQFSDFPDDPESILWVARKTAAFWRYRDAIFILTDGLSDNSSDFRFYRFRGHYYLNIREFDHAVEDLRTAVSLLGDWSGQNEPDAISGASFEPSATYGYTTWYHLGLAYYMKGEFSQAQQAFLNASEFAQNSDTRIQSIDWLFLSQLRGGTERLDLAKIRQIIASAEQLSDGRSNLHRIYFMIGEYETVAAISSEAFSGERMLSEAFFGDYSPAEQLNLRYAHALKLQLSGDLSAARAAYMKILDTNYWASFSYIAAEAELHRIGID